VKHKLIIKEEATQEAVESSLWYEKQQPGLGNEFLRQIEQSLENISNHPLHYQKTYSYYRQIIVRRFPYVITFEVAGDAIIVYAIFHTSQNPKKKFRK
jgi:plasmid stabilization system protein ParE